MQSLGSHYGNGKKPRQRRDKGRNQTVSLPTTDPAGELHIVMTMSYVKRSPIPQLTHPSVTSHRYDMNDVKQSLMQQMIQSNVISHRCDMSDVKNNDKISHPKKTEFLP